MGMQLDRSFYIPPDRRVPSAQLGVAALGILGVLGATGALTCAVIWAMHITAKSAAVPEYSRAVTASGGLPSAKSAGGGEAIARLFGGTAPAQTAVGDIEGVQLLGIVAGPRATGVALFSIEGGPPLRVRTGGRVREGVTLVEIRSRKVVLERGGVTVERELPARGSSPTALSVKSDARVAGIPPNTMPSVGVPVTGSLPPVSSR
jgi:hypothetical protein